MDIMLDLETLGVRCGSVILSIGACVFDRLGGYDATMPSFHTFLKPKGQLQVGATIDPSTVLWWMDVSDEGRKAMVAGQKSAVQPVEALLAFSDWVDRITGNNRDSVKIWANGADFDLALLVDLYRRFGLEAPWPYNGARDMRTIMDLAGVKPKDLWPTPTGAHDALTDAVYQARVTALAIRQIKRV